MLMVSMVFVKNLIYISEPVRANHRACQASQQMEDLAFGGLLME